jgi:microcompartment protein CcmK/EutM
MYTGEVVGKVVCTQKESRLEGLTLLLVRTREKKPRLVVAADATGVAGSGDRVYVIGSKEAAMAFGRPLPIDASIVGIIDTVCET